MRKIVRLYRCNKCNRTYKPAVPKSPGASTPRPSPQANEMPDVDAFAQLDAMIAGPPAKEGGQGPPPAGGADKSSKPPTTSTDKEIAASAKDATDSGKTTPPPAKDAESPKPQKAATLRENYTSDGSRVFARRLERMHGCIASI